MKIEFISGRADAFFRKVTIQEQLRAKADAETFTPWQVVWNMGAFKVEHEEVHGPTSEKKLAEIIRAKVPFMKVA